MIRHQLTTGPTGTGKTWALGNDIADHTERDGMTWMYSPCEQGDLPGQSPRPAMVGATHRALHEMLTDAVNVLEYRDSATVVPTAVIPQEHTPLLLALDDLGALLHTNDDCTRTFNCLAKILRRGHEVGIRVHATAEHSYGLPQVIRAQFDLNVLPKEAS